MFSKEKTPPCPTAGQEVVAVTSDQVAFPSGSPDPFIDECPSWCVEEHQVEPAHFGRAHESEPLAVALQMHPGWVEDDPDGLEMVHVAAAEVRLRRLNRRVRPSVNLMRRELRDGQVRETALYELTIEEAVRLAAALVAMADRAAEQDRA